MADLRDSQCGRHLADLLRTVAGKHLRRQSKAGQLPDGRPRAGAQLVGDCERARRLSVLRKPHGGFVLVIGIPRGNPFLPSQPIDASAHSPFDPEARNLAEILDLDPGGPQGGDGA